MGDVAREPRLAALLRDRDVACPGCGYNLRGCAGPNCPECGAVIPLPDPSPPGGGREDAVRRLIEHLADHDLICTHCRYNLRGLGTNVCPECGATYAMSLTRRVFPQGAGEQPVPRRRPAWERIAGLLSLGACSVIAAMCVADLLVRNESWTARLAGVVGGLALAGAVVGLILLRRGGRAGSARADRAIWLVVAVEIVIVLFAGMLRYA